MVWPCCRWAVVEAVLDPDAVVDLAGSTNGRPFYNNDGNNFSPNIGIAWQPGPGNRTVVRAGYGINYVVDNGLTTVLNALRGNAGLTQTVALSGLSGTVSGGGLVPIPVPEFRIPRTARDGILADSTGRHLHHRPRHAHPLRAAVEHRGAAQAHAGHRR